MRGATGTPAEIQIVENYLAKNLAGPQARAAGVRRPEPPAMLGYCCFVFGRERNSEFKSHLEGTR